MKNDSALGRVVRIDEVLERLRRRAQRGRVSLFHSRVSSVTERAAPAGSSPQSCRKGLCPATGRIHVERSEEIMSGETLLIWLVVGLVAGWLASAVVGGGLGVVGDIVIGIVGSFLGGLIFRTAHIGTPFHGVAASIFVAFVGAVALLLILRLIRRTPRRL
jgi:uncharacterized membrane protein YeaQ/YmgE (transglycosylase-associated protein family)